MVPLNTPAHTSTTARASLAACGSRGGIARTSPGIARTSSDSRRRRWQDKSAQLAGHLDDTAEFIPSVAHQSGRPVSILPNSIIRVVPASGWPSDWLTLVNQRRKTQCGCRGLGSVMCSYCQSHTEDVVA